MFAVNTVLAQDAEQEEAPPVDPNTEQARRLFSEGVALSDAGRWTIAAQRFREALELKDAQAIRYNLASTLIELGEFHEADALLAEVLADGEASEALRRSAIQARGDIRARAAELRFTEPQVTRVDGRFLPADYLDKPLFLPPGEHIIEQVQGGRVVEQRVVTLDAASITTVRWSEATWEPAQRAPVAAVAEEGATSQRAPIRFSPLQPSRDAAESAPVGTIIAVGFTVALVIAVGALAAATTDGNVDANNLEAEPAVGGPRAPTGVQVLRF